MAFLRDGDFCLGVLAVCCSRCHGFENAKKQLGINVDLDGHKIRGSFREQKHVKTVVVNYGRLLFWDSVLIPLLEGF